MSKYDYILDTLGRRTFVALTGSAFTGGSGEHHWDFGYNSRSELTAGSRRAGTTPDQGDPIMPASHTFAYDAIGNRKSGGLDATSWYYCVNNVNQYETIDDEDSCPPQAAQESLTHDADGNLAADGTHTFIWDGENRLKEVYPTSPSSGSKKLVFAYDHMSRRVRKQVFPWNANTNDWDTVPSSDLRFVYDEWNVVVVLDGLNDNALMHQYTWGLDLSGLSGTADQNRDRQGAAGIHGAGGVGGLLAAVEIGGDNQGSYWFLYDGNGNVGQVLDTADLDGNPVAKYEYDPYGNQLVSTGDYAAANPFRFSTKWLDSELSNPFVKGAVGPRYNHILWMA